MTGGRVMKKQKFYQVVLFFMVAFFSIFSVTSPVFAGNDEAAVDNVRLAFNAAYVKGDAQAMGALIDRDAVWMPPTGEQAIIGADKIVARYKKFFEKIRSAFELQPGAIQISGQWAFLHGAWHRKDADKQSGQKMIHGGYYLMVFKKQADGSWKIARDIWNDSRKQP